MLPSKDDIPTNSVNTIPSTQITLLLRNLASLSICTFEEILEIMLSETDIRAIGINIVFMKLPINVIQMPLTATAAKALPVYLLKQFHLRR